MKLSLVFVYQARFASDYKLTATLDDDGAAALHTLYKTTLTNDNRWFAYGPVYYRLARTFNLLSHVESVDPSSREEFYYFSLIFVSLASLLACFWAIGYVLFSSVVQAALWGLSFFFVFLHSGSPSFILRYILHPHPDYSQTLFMVSTVLLGYFFYESKNPRFAYGSFFCLGVAFSTKASTLYFGAAYVLVFSLLLTDRRMSFTAKLLLTLGAGYFLAGFPQNFKVQKTLDFLLYMRRFNQPVTWLSVSEWIKLLFANLFPAILCVFALPPSKGSYGSRSLGLVWLSTILAFLLFALTVNSAVFSKHYIINYLLLFIVLLSLSLPRLLKRIEWSLLYSSWGLRILALIAFCLPLPPYFSESIASKDKCRSPVIAASQEFQSLSLHHKDHMYDAYFPYPRGSKVRRTWGLKSSDFTKPSTLVGLNWKFIDDFFGGLDAYNSQTNPQFKENKEFYESIRGKETASLDNLTLNRMKKFDCGLEIWSVSRRED